jgi:hypothetical protein
MKDKAVNPIKCREMSLATSGCQILEFFTSQKLKNHHKKRQQHIRMHTSVHKCIQFDTHSMRTCVALLIDLPQPLDQWEIQNMLISWLIHKFYEFFSLQKL